MNNSLKISFTRTFRASLLLAIFILFCDYLKADERQRPTISENTLITDAGTLMRGSTIWLINGSQHQTFINWGTGETCWNTFEKYNLNAVRVACGYNLDSGEDKVYSLEQYISWLDDFVKRAEEKNLYIMIDYHMIGLHPAIEEAKTFWKEVAPRYKDRTHVIYELANEPVKWTPSEYTDIDMQDQQDLYDIVRAAAPETPIILLSFAVSQNWNDNPPPHMVDVAHQLVDIDWENSLVGFHGYWVTSSADMMDLKQDFPVLNTEFMGPPHSFDGAKEIDGTRWQVEIMEREKISWFGWNINHNGEGSISDLYEDAVAKGYYWAPDPDNSLSDTLLPSKPDSIYVKSSDGNNIKLVWNASEDDSEVVGYYVYINQARPIFVPLRIITLSDVNPDSVFSVIVEALDEAGNVSQQSEEFIYPEVVPTNKSPIYNTTQRLSVFPNPLKCNNSLQIHLNSANKNSTIRIYDLFGHEMFNEYCTTKQKVIKIPSGYFKRGIYVVSVKNNNFYTCQKLITNE